jgi:mersacidin/lichenicidin family type 2 lantibiotic
MINILRSWGKEAHSQSLSTEKQAMMPAEAAELIDLTDAALQAVYGGCGQSVHHRHGHHQSQGGCYTQHHGHHQHDGHNGHGYGYRNGGYGNGGYGNGGCGGSSHQNYDPSSSRC